MYKLGYQVAATMVPVMLVDEEVVGVATTLALCPLAFSPSHYFFLATKALRQGFFPECTGPSLHLLYPLLFFGEEFT